MNAMTRAQPREAYLRLPEVRAATGLSRATIYRRIAAKQFPEQRDLGGSAVGWKLSEIEEWLANRPPRRPHS